MRNTDSSSRCRPLSEVLVVASVGVAAAACAVVVAIGGAIQPSAPASRELSLCQAVIGQMHLLCGVAAARTTS